MKRILSLCLYGMTFALASHAGILTLNPTDGVVSGAPGATVNWGFTITADPTYWTVINAVQVGSETLPVGPTSNFTDLISSSSFYLLSPNTNLTDTIAGSPLASFLIPNTTSVGTSSPVFSILLNYELFDGDPNVNGNQVGLDLQASANAQINVVAPDTGGTGAPEPGTWLLLITALPVLVWRGRRAVAARG